MANIDMSWRVVFAGVTVAAGSLLEEPDISSGIGASAENPLALGDQSSSAARIVIRTSALPAVWENIRCEVWQTENGIERSVFVGAVTGYDGNLDVTTVQAEGFATAINNVRVYSPLMQQRPVATATTATSIEDPAAVGWSAGPINYIFWQAGGRPLAQAGTYPTALFYYSCDQAALAPDWSWVAGERGWPEAQLLARAAACQVYQDRSGVMRVREPLRLATGTPVSITNGEYLQVRTSASTRPVYTQIVCGVIPRAARAMQEIVRDGTVTLIPTGATITRELQLQWPVLRLDAPSNQLPADALTITDMAGNTLGVTTTHTISLAAQRLVLTITNTTGRPLILHRVLIRGVPVQAGPSSTQTVGTGTARRTLEESPYIQTPSYARRLAALYLALEGTARPIRIVEGVINTATMDAGNVISLTAVELGLTNSLHLVTDVTRRGATMDLTCVFVGDLPNTNDTYQYRSTPYTAAARIGF